MSDSELSQARELGRHSPIAGLNYVASGALGLFALTFVVYFFTGKVTQYDYFVPLADGFLHGRLSISHPRPALLDELVRGRDGALYVIYPPMPAILLLPEVAIWGLKTNQTIVCMSLGSLNVALVFLLTRRLTRSVRLQLWMTLLFAFGTIHWFIASTGPSWYLAHVVSFLFLTLAIYATLSHQRPFVIGLLVGASYFSRLPTILSLPFFVIMLADEWYRRSDTSSLLRRIRFEPLLALGTGIGIFVCLDFVYNYARFGTPRDVAYYIQARNEPQVYPAGLFDFSYVPKHLWIMFLKPPVFSAEPPYILPSAVGLSILFTTPAFIYCLFAGVNRVSLACWSAIAPVALLNFTHGGTGWVQFGYRFAMDYYPFLLVLMGLGLGTRIRQDGKLTITARVLILLSILVNFWGVLWINKFGWIGHLSHP